MKFFGILVDGMSTFIQKAGERPLLTGVVGTVNGSATMALIEFWKVYDQLIFRIGATATAAASILSVLILLRKWRKKGDN